MRLAWLTDIHLNFLEPARLTAFLKEMARSAADAVVISGDIGDAPSLARYLTRMERAAGRPIYFVLGNHDFYHGSIRDVRAAVGELCAVSPHLRWLPVADVTPLTRETALVGHDSWADGGYGDYAGSGVVLNDFYLIEELTGLDPESRLSQLRILAEEAATHFSRVLPAALERFPHVLLLTHVPPFAEACWHRGKMSAPDWLPHFSSKAVGDVLLALMRAYPHRRMTVLCGHTHSDGAARMLPNLLVVTGGARYGAPAISAVFDADEGL